MKNTDSPKRVLLLEGKTDEIIVGIVVRNLRIADVRIENYGGINNLLRDLTAFIKGSNAMSIGIIVDANESLEERWQSIRDRLINSDLDIELPTKPNRHGVVEKFGNQRIGVWVMPDNERPGALEDFVKEMIPNDGAWRFARDYVERVKGGGIQVNESKSQVYAWLAIVAPGTQMGAAFGRGKFKSDTTSYGNFENWIKTLCE